MIAELDAINLYEQMADMTQSRNIRKLLLDVAKEEKTHVGEFEALLLMKDKEQEKELKKGKEEAEALMRRGLNTKIDFSRVKIVQGRLPFLMIYSPDIHHGRDQEVWNG